MRAGGQTAGWKDEAASGVCGGLCSNLLDEVREVNTLSMSDHGLLPPSVTLIVVGTHDAAVAYAKSTVAAARASGVSLNLTQLPDDAAQADVAALIHRLNGDPDCHGIILQLPLPPSLDAGALIASISDDKEVDCLKESSVRRCFLRSEPTVAPCLAAACEEVLRSLDILRSPKAPKPKAEHKAAHGGGGRARAAARPARPHALLLGVPPLLAFPLELSLEAAGCRVSTLADGEDADSCRAELQAADVLLIGRRRPDVVAAQWVRSGCVLLDLGLASCSAPTPIAMAHQHTHCAQTAERAPERPESDHSGNESDEEGGAAAGGGEAAAPAAPSVVVAEEAEGPPPSRDVLCLCCSDGLSAITAAMRMRNLSHLALVQQGFIETIDGRTSQPSSPNRREAPVMEIDALPPAYLGAAPSTHHGGSGHQRQPYQQHYSQPQAPPPSAIAYVSPPLPPEYDTFCMGSPYDVCPR